MKKLMIFLVALAGLLYALSIVYAGILSLQQQTVINSFLVTTVVLIGGVLSTNLGAVLGATFTPPQPVVPKPGLEGNKAIPKVSLPPKFLRFRPSLRPSSRSTALEGNTPQETTDTSQKIQIIACWVYIASLVLALIFYITGMIKQIPNEKMVLIPDLVKTLIGVLAGSVAVSLGGNKN